MDRPSTKKARTRARRRVRRQELTANVVPHREKFRAADDEAKAWVERYHDYEQPADAVGGLLRLTLAQGAELRAAGAIRLSRISTREIADSGREMTRSHQ
jgi:hypothetical protein